MGRKAFDVSDLESGDVLLLHLSTIRYKEEEREKEKEKVEAGLGGSRRRGRRKERRGRWMENSVSSYIDSLSPHTL